MKTIRYPGLIAVLIALPLIAGATVPVPGELKGWEPWVLQGHEEHACPWLVPGAPNDGARICAWPGELTLEVDAHGGRFSQRWQAAIETWLLLPGSSEHWPEAVTVDGAAAGLVTYRGAPAVRITAGEHALAGTFRWSHRPAALAVPASVGLVALRVDGTRVATVQRVADGIVLGAQSAARAEDRADMRVFRRLADGLPSRLMTRIRIAVSGEARELRLAQALPEGFVPVAVESDLAARLDPDGTLRVQLRPGKHLLSIDARGPSPPSDIRLGQRPAPWPADEVWSFKAEDRLRIVSIEGPASVDPAQAEVPDEWTELPAYQMRPASVLRIAEHSRGLAAQDLNELHLTRRAWLGFVGDSYTLVDHIQGQLRKGWRLDMAAPYELKSASSDASVLLVTTGAGAGSSGVELRSPDIDLSAVSQLPKARGALAATGWQERFASVSGELVLAPGYRLLAAFGPDATPDAWLERWHLFDIFALLLIATVAWRVLGVPAAAIAALAVALTYQEPSAPNWLWLNALVAIALVRALPEGRLRAGVGVYRALAVVVLLIAFAPFALNQVRLAVYPQLEALAAPHEPQEPQVGKKARAVALQEIVVTGQHAKTNGPPAPRLVPPPAPKVQGGLTNSLSESPNPLDVQAALRAVSEPAYEPGAVMQTGPGIPVWRYHVYRYSWNGPVDASETLRFAVSPPWLTRAWRVLGVAFSVLLLALLAGQALPGASAWWGRRWPLATALLLSLAFFGAPDARAASTPDPKLLDELRAKLLEPPKCAPDCADVLAAEVRVEASRLSVTLTASALDGLGLALPSVDRDFSPDRLEVDGHAAGGVYRNTQGQRFISLARGRHVVRLEGTLAERDALTLSFPIVPHVVDVAAEGWDVGGLNERRLVSGALELARRRLTQASAATSSRQTEFPAYVSVERRLHIATEWSLRTTVTRVAPAVGAFTVRLPLLPREAVTTAGLQVADGAVSVGLGSDDESRSYSSALPASTAIELVATPDASRSEHWSFDVGPSWHAEFSGLPATAPGDGGGTWTFDYYPRPGERLKVAITRPAAVPGGTLAFDAATLRIEVGDRSSNSELELAYRSTQGGRQALLLPADAVVTRVTSDDETVAVRPENGQLLLAVLPGSHAWGVQWQRQGGARVFTRPDAVALGAPVSNLRTTLTVPEGRWVLYAFGAGVGPAILYWGELLIFVVVAVALGRSRLTPLGTREWLLLGLGLSTFSWLALMLFVAFVATFEWRSRHAAPASRSRFQLMQIGLAALAVIAIASLIAAIPRGLLAQPDMRVEGLARDSALTWFLDQSAGDLPTPTVMSVSLWWYKLAMLGWALWLSFALTRWIKWAWQVYAREGLWRSSGVDSAPPAPASPPAAFRDVD
jgi:hypothetical protein